MSTMAAELPIGEQRRLDAAAFAVSGRPEPLRSSVSATLWLWALRTLRIAQDTALRLASVVQRRTTIVLTLVVIPSLLVLSACTSSPQTAPSPSLSSSPSSAFVGPVPAPVTVSQGELDLIQQMHDLKAGPSLPDHAAINAAMTALLNQLYADIQSGKTDPQFGGPDLRASIALITATRDPQVLNFEYAFFQAAIAANSSGATNRTLLKGTPLTSKDASPSYLNAVASGLNGALYTLIGALEGQMAIVNVSPQSPSQSSPVQANAAVIRQRSPDASGTSRARR